MELFGIDANNTVDVAITFYLTMAYLLLSVFPILKLEYKDLLLVLYYFILVVLVCCNLFPFFYVYNSFLFWVLCSLSYPYILIHGLHLVNDADSADFPSGIDCSSVVGAAFWIEK